MIKRVLILGLCLGASLVALHSSAQSPAHVPAIEYGAFGSSSSPIWDRTVYLDGERYISIRYSFVSEGRYKQAVADYNDPNFNPAPDLIVARLNQNFARYVNGEISKDTFKSGEQDILEKPFKMSALPLVVRRQKAIANPGQTSNVHWHWAAI